MSEVIELIKGQTYYRAAFFDKNLSIPSVDTYIYEGCEDEHGHLFINAEGHVAIIESIARCVSRLYTCSVWTSPRLQALFTDDGKVTTA